MAKITIMNLDAKITTLFLDIGGVLLTNGWEKHSRELAAEKFNLNFQEVESRHRLTFDTYEIGKITLEEYLNRSIFYESRSFTLNDFITFMYEQSKPFPEMIELIKYLKKQYGLKVAAVSNEGKELTEYRVRKFNLGDVFDFFASSCFLHLRKPDTEIYRIALDLAQAKPEQVLYIEDRDMFVEVAQSVGIKGILHKDYQSTREKLASIGLCRENAVLS